MSYIESLQFRGFREAIANGFGVTGPTGPNGTGSVGATGPTGPGGSGYIVPTGYSTIQGAIDAAAANGGGDIIILNGDYTENLVLADKVNLMACAQPSLNYTSIFAPVKITGTMEIISGTAKLSNILFENPTISPTISCQAGGVLTITDSHIGSGGGDCVFADGNVTLQRCNLPGYNSAAFMTIGANAESVTLDDCITNSTINSAASPGYTLNLKRCTLIALNATIITFPPSCTLNSSYNYYSSGTSTTFDTLGTINSQFDTVKCNSLSGNYATGSSGTMRYASLILAGTATGNTVATKTVYPFST